MSNDAHNSILPAWLSIRQELMMYTACGFCKLPSWKQQFQLGGIKVKKKKKKRQDRRILCPSLSHYRWLLEPSLLLLSKLRATGKWLKFGSRMSKPLEWLNLWRFYSNGEECRMWKKPVALLPSCCEPEVSCLRPWSRKTQFWTMPPPPSNLILGLTANEMLEFQPEDWQTVFLNDLYPPSHTTAMPCLSSHPENQGGIPVSA